MVTITFGADSLIGVRTEDHVPVFDWSYAGISRASRPGDNTMNIGHADGGDAELTLNGHAAVDLLHRHTSWRSPVHGLGLRRLGQAAGLLVGVTHTRSMEAEADRVALDILQHTQVDPSGMADFFERMSKQEEGSGFSLPSFLSPHPASETRAQRIQERPAGRVQAVLVNDEWDALRKICEVHASAS